MSRSEIPLERQSDRRSRERIQVIFRSCGVNASRRLASAPLARDGTRANGVLISRSMQCVAEQPRIPRHNSGPHTLNSDVGPTGQTLFVRLVQVDQSDHYIS